MLVVQVPYTVLIPKDYVSNPYLIKLKGNEYIKISTIVTINNDELNNYYQLNGDLAIPFIVYNNWMLKCMPEIAKMFGSISNKDINIDEIVALVNNFTVINISDSYKIEDMLPVQEFRNAFAMAMMGDVLYNYIMEKYALPYIDKK